MPALCASLVGLGLRLRSGRHEGDQRIPDGFLHGIFRRPSNVKTVDDCLDDMTPRVMNWMTSVTAE
jgi:hypothetical protein